eukprot:15678-Heterococcus_DN1.PRE.1
MLIVSPGGNTVIVMHASDSLNVFSCQNIAAHSFQTTSAQSMTKGKPGADGTYPKPRGRPAAGKTWNSTTGEWEDSSDAAAPAAAAEAAAEPVAEKKATRGKQTVAKAVPAEK